VSDAQDVRVTLKSDVFAFAVTMWEMATRMHPWHGLGVLAVRCAAQTKAGLRCSSDTNAMFPVESIAGLCASRSTALCGTTPRKLSVRTRTATYTHSHTRLHTHTHTPLTLTLTCKLLEQVATKVVTQNARLPVALVEQVRDVHGCRSPVFPSFQFCARLSSQRLS
jgi:hypothetical protein